jgi:heme-degrading monooxygenase HmoA
MAREREGPMAIGAKTVLPDMTHEAYEQMAQHLLPRIKDRPGFLLHISGTVEGGGYSVIEVWESEELFNRWIEEEVMPAGQQAGVAVPSTEIYPVSNVVQR